MSAQKSEHPAQIDTIKANDHHANAVEHQHNGTNDRPPKSPEDLDVYASYQKYYGSSHAPRRVAKSRTMSVASHTGGPARNTSTKPPRRRGSQDARSTMSMKYMVDVDSTLKTLLAQEDTDGNVQITIEDAGPKTMLLRTAASGGYRHADIRGTYMLSNLLQELTLAKSFGRKQIVLDEARLNENPVNRLSRLIKDQFWPNLTRRIDGSNIEFVARDPKDWTSDPRPRIYVPKGAPDYYHYYQRIAREHPHFRLDVQWLDDCAAHETPEADDYVRDLNDAPGLLAIAMERVVDTPSGEPDFKGLPFIVPGGRFNELYGWDSYMATLGLLINDRVDLCEAMVKHFCFSIRHYGKILNANRSYYLRRSQPPFLTDMALRTYEKIEHQPHGLDFIREAFLASIKDYYCTWMSAPRYDPESGLSRYHPGGRGVPPETEATHFLHILQPYADKYGLTFEKFVHCYNYGHIEGLNAEKQKMWEHDQRELNEYFRHDRAVRESGHDTSYRLERVAADLATVDLNSCLYKYEADIARAITALFHGKLEIPAEWQVPGRPTIEVAATWSVAAEKRRSAMNKLMWNEKDGMYFDYNVVEKAQTGYESATTFWAMWAGVASYEQACVMVQKAVPKFEERGGLVSGTEKSRGKIDKHRPNRQWDYPFGWAPQQILAWTGLQRFGFEAEAQRLAYRWLHMCTKAFVDFNGVVVEKYDVTQKVHPHRVTAEYGNQGGDFKGAATEGFGWVNASYVYGLQIVNEHMKRALGAVTPWETFQKMTELPAEERWSSLHDNGHGHAIASTTPSPPEPTTAAAAAKTHEQQHAPEQHAHSHDLLDAHKDAEAESRAVHDALVHAAAQGGNRHEDVNMGRSASISHSMSQAVA